MKRLNRLFFICSVLTVCSFTVLTAGAQVQTPRYITTTSNSKGYWEYLPEGYGLSNETYPLLLCLHGIGSLGNGSVAQLPRALNGLPGAWIKSGSFPKSFKVNGQTFKFIVITPQFVKWPAPGDINNILDYIIAHYRVDLSRIYLTGLSMGGGATWDYASSKYGKRLAAIVPVCGASNLGSRSRSITSANLPVWALHNDDDPTVPVSNTINNVTNINAAPAPNPAARKTIFHAASHDAWTKTYNPTEKYGYKEDGMNVYEWMLQYQRGGNTPPASSVMPVNQLPVVNAGADRIVQLPTSSLTLLGSAIDADGKISSYQWSKISGPSTYRIEQPAAANTAVRQLSEGVYLFELRATDNEGAVGKDTVQVTVKAAPNQTPTAHAGADQTVILPVNSVVLKGSGTDSDGTIASYLWSKISGPSSGSMASASSAQTTVSGLVQGIYLFELTVTDNAGAKGKDTVKVIVNAAISKPVVNSCNTAAPVTYTLKTTAPNEIYLPNGTGILANVKGGDTIKIPAGNYATIVLGNFAGDACRPVVITNTGGTVQAEYIRIDNDAHHFKVLGNGTKGITYGFRLGKPGSPFGIAVGIAHHYEIAYVECVNGDVGFFLKKNPDVTVPKSLYPNYTITKVLVHHNYVHNTRGEGMYIGHTYPKADPYSNNLVPIRMDSVEIYNNIIDSTDWDGIQLSNALNGALIHHNTVKNFGLSNVGSQQAGIILGANTNGKIYNNYIQRGTGNGIQVFGYGSVSVQNNVVIDAGQDKTTTKQDAIFIDDRPLSGNPGLRVNVLNNTVVNSGRDGIRMYNSYGTVATGSVFYNNLIVKPGSVGYSNSPYINYPVNLGITEANNLKNATIAEAGFINAAAGNYHLLHNAPAVDFGKDASSLGVLDDLDNNRRPYGKGYDAGAYEMNTPAPNQAPKANAGADQTITLPENSITLKGSGQDGDGTIVSYQWTKVIGPQATITSYDKAQITVSGLVQGLYRFQLKVTDNDGAIAVDTVQVTVNKAPNKAPTVSAGSNQTITLPVDSVVVKGSAQDSDGRIASYQWTKVSGPAAYAIGNKNELQTSITNLTEGIYQFEVRVSDNEGAIAKDTLQIIVKAALNKAPVANAGSNITIQLPEHTVMLNGSGSDSDGSIATYQWRKISGPARGSILKATQPQTIVSGLAEGTYVFELKVTDNGGLSATDTMMVIVKAAKVAPVANAGRDMAIQLPVDSVILRGSGSDADGTIIGYAWNKITGPVQGTIVRSTSAHTPVTQLAEGIYVFGLTVTDNDGLTTADTVQVTVKAGNKAPKVSAGSDMEITLPQHTVSLNGIASDEDGSIASYQWIKVSGPASANINNGNQAKATATGLVKGIYQFALKVTDYQGAMASDTVQITVKDSINKVPVANAGINITVQLPVNTVTLNGSGTDSDGSIASYQWKKLDGPLQGNIANANKAQTTVTNLAQGIYLFQLTVTDNGGQTAADTVMVTVKAANLPPAVDAGRDIAITLPVNAVNLSGYATDADGTITSYNWSKISGPSTGIFTTSNQPNTIFTGLVQGIYEVVLTATDNQGATAKDTLHITVNAPLPLPNKQPVVSAGPDMIITLPVNSITLSGTATDSDGNIVSYEWKKVSGANTYTIANANKAQTKVAGLTEGIYQFALTVTDNDGATASDTVRVVVNAVPNKAPVAHAGNDIVITLPNNTVTLSGKGSDEDGNIASYEWSKISGPTAGVIEDVASAQTRASGLAEGTYVFELKVTDSKGLTATGKVHITVKAAPNKTPKANAGKNMQITLPVNTITLSGTGTDDDGTIVSYRWSKVPGSNAGTITAPNHAQTTVTNLAAGQYIFQLEVTDDRGASDSDSIIVIVNKPANKIPVAKAGANQSIQLPANTVTLSGSGVDTDGTIADYQWEKISGPAANIATPNQDKTIINGLAEGIYLFELTVTDNDGAIAKDTVSVMVKAANKAPKVFAGNKVVITLPANSVPLNGSATDEDGLIASYQWIKVSGPAAYTIKQVSAATTMVTNLVAGSYQFALTVTDNQGAIGKDTVQVIVNRAPNQKPIVNAGADRTVQMPTTSLTLLGSGSDADGQIVAYKWSKISGPSSYRIKSPAAAQTSVYSLSVGIYLFELQVTDNEGAIAVDTVQVTVNKAPNKAPTVSAGSNQTITLPVDSVVVKGSAQDSDGRIASYQWTKVSGPAAYAIGNKNELQTSITNLTEGIYQFEVRVSDNEGAIAKDTLQIIVKAALNKAPVANAGVDQTIQLPNNQIKLSGNGTDADGTVVAYQWRKIAGSDVFTIANAKAAQTTVAHLATGVYQFELTVTDNQGATATDTVQITVKAQPANLLPIANAGSNITITLPVSGVVLNGSGSDKDGDIVSYQWSKIAGPQASITQPAKAQTNVNGLVQGIYLFRLQVTDDRGGVASDTVQVIVNAAPNKAPVAYAGNDIVITLPANTIALNGTGSDEDGNIASYAWSKIAGPAQGNILNRTQPQTIVSGLVQGTYVFELKVTDDEGVSAVDTIEVTVNEAPNKAPKANAGAAQTIQLPTNSVTLNGKGIDEDGKIVSYHWQSLDNGDKVIIINPNSAYTTVTGLAQGTYSFELIVTDNKGAIAKDTVQVTVKEAPVVTLQLSAYPNPVVNDLYINVQTPVKMTASTRIRIINMNGNVVYQETYTRGESKDVKKIDMRNLRSGVYFVEVSVGFAKETLKIVKN